MNDTVRNITPIPQGKYIPATRYGNIIFTAGMTPRRNGNLIYKGKVSISKPIDDYKESVRLATANAFTAVCNLLGHKEHLVSILNLTVFIAASENFQAHSRIADFASEYLEQITQCMSLGSRSAIGVASLPGNAPIEIQLIAAVFVDNK